MGVEYKYLKPGYKINVRPRKDLIVEQTQGLPDANFSIVEDESSAVRCMWEGYFIGLFGEKERPIYRYRKITPGKNCISLGEESNYADASIIHPRQLPKEILKHHKKGNGRWVRIRLNSKLEVRVHKINPVLS